MIKNKYLYFVMIALLCAVTTLSSCSKDDDETVTESSICGKWECISTHYGGWSNSDGMSVGDILYLNKDNTYKVTGNNKDTGKWKLSGNKLVCTSNNIPWTYTIAEHTNSKLTIVADWFGITWSFKRC